MIFVNEPKMSGKRANTIQRIRNKVVSLIFWRILHHAAHDEFIKKYLPLTITFLLDQLFIDGFQFTR